MLGRLLLVWWTGMNLLSDVRSSSSTSFNSTECNSTDSLVRRLMSELSNTRNELDKAKVQLEEARQRIVNLTPKETQRHEVHANDYKNDANNKFSGHKLVHLDFGGAPPKLTYLLQLLPFFRKWGATGLLIEYADTFPYSGELEVIQGPDVFSQDEVLFLIKEAQRNDLIVIPLVQTFGHLEFVLKHEKFAHLRETAKYTNSICPKNPGAVELVKEMINQVAQLHLGIQWFHVGADEVWNLKTCRACLDDNRNKSMIFLQHMLPVLQYVRDKGFTPILWDDMMREWTIDFLKVVGRLAEPMIWYYRTDLRSHFPKEMYQRYFEAFPKMWTASAFKGATGPSSDYVSISKHVSNNLQWVDIMSKISKTNEVLGIALTGWSRYDHYGTLCELLPAGIPSLVFCLKAVDEGQMNESLRITISKELGFSDRINLDGTEYYNEKRTYGDFPGHEVYELIFKLKDIHHALGLVHSTERGWMLKRQLEEHSLSYFRLRFAHMKSMQAATSYEEIRHEAQASLLQIYSNTTVIEWLKDKIDDRITDAQFQISRIESVESMFDFESR